PARIARREHRALVLRQAGARPVVADEAVTPATRPRAGAAALTRDFRLCQLQSFAGMISARRRRKAGRSEASSGRLEPAAPFSNRHSADRSHPPRDLLVPLS